MDVVIANSSIPDGPTPAGLKFITYRRPVDGEALLMETDVIDQTATARHDPAKLSQAVADAYRRHRGPRRRLPPPPLAPPGGRGD